MVAAVSDRVPENQRALAPAIRFSAAESHAGKSSGACISAAAKTVARLASPYRERPETIREGVERHVRMVLSLQHTMDRNQRITWRARRSRASRASPGE